MGRCYSGSRWWGALRRGKGDFNGDGRVDFAVANDGVDYVSVFLTR